MRTKVKFDTVSRVFKKREKEIIIMKRKLSLVLAAAMTLTIALAGCTPAASDPTDSPDNTQPGGETTVRTDMNAQLFSECTSLDPQVNPSSYDLAVMYQIYDSLFEPVDGDYNNLKGSLCESYEVDDAQMNYTLHIRQGVLWHNGDTLTADDVVFSINRMRESAVTMARISFITDVQKVDDYTVTIACAYPSPRLPALFSTASMSIVNKKLVEQYGDNAIETVVGTGAYKLESWEPGGNIVLTSFEEGWRGSPQIKTITYKLITDTNAARIAFQNGEIDTFYASAATDLELFSDETKYTTTAYTNSTQDHLAFNVSRTDSWVSDKTFRQAVAYAIDREALAEITSDGLYKVANSVVAPGNAAYSDTPFPYEYNPEKAKELLADCGYDGAEVGLLYTSSYPISNTWGTTVEAYLRAVGINVKMEGQEYASVVQRVTDRDYDMTMFEYSVSFPDPLSSFYAMFRSDGYYNVWQYITDEMDQRIIELYGEADDNARNQAMMEIDEWAKEEVLYIPSYQQGGYYFRPVELTSTTVPEPMFGWTRICYSSWEA